MKEKHKELLLIFLFFFFSIFIFRNYFLKKEVPFPSNLLVAFYQPFASYPWEDYSNGPPSKPLGFDNLRIFYPLRKLTIDQIKKMEPPLWNPYNFSGNTHLATYQSAVFHPLSFLFFILPQIDAWSAVIILAPFFSSLFMYLFLREFSLSKRSSFFGAITFGFSGFMIVWWEESFMSVYSSLFLPLILYSIERIFKKINSYDFIILTLGLVFSILSGWFQMTFYVLVFSVLWIIFRYLKEDDKHRNKKLLLIISSYFLSFVISAVHLIPSAEAYFYSARGTTDAKFIFDSYLQPWYHLVTYLAPDFFGNPAVFNYFGGSFYHEKILYVGIIPLLFAILEFVHYKKSLGKIKFFKWLWIITLSLGFSIPTSWIILYHLKIPFISVILPSRIFFLSAFCVSVLSAFGIERFLSGKIDKKKLIIILLFFQFIFVLLWAYALYYKTANPYSKYLTVPLKNLILPQGIFLLSVFLILSYLKFKNLKRYIFFGIIFVSFFSSAYFANKYLYFSKRNFVFPKTEVLSNLEKTSGIDRFWGVGKGYMDRNFATFYNIFSPEGYDSFYIQRYGELMFAGINKGQFSKEIPRTDAVISGIENLSSFNNPHEKRLANLLGVKYIVADNSEKRKEADKNINLQNFIPFWNDDKFTIYENKNTIPRIFLADNYVVLKENQLILNEIFNEKTDLSKTIILEEDPQGFLKGSQSGGLIRLVSYTPNKIVIETDSAKSKLLFISDNYYPGWRAKVDNKETKIYRADYSFRSIVVPEGKHLVVFEYKPASFYIGIAASVVGVLMFLAISIKIKKS